MDTSNKTPGERLLEMLRPWYHHTKSTAFSFSEAASSLATDIRSVTLDPIEHLLFFKLFMDLFVTHFSETAPKLFHALQSAFYKTFLPELKKRHLNATVGGTALFVSVFTGVFTLVLYWIVVPVLYYIWELSTLIWFTAATMWLLSLAAAYVQMPQWLEPHIASTKRRFKSFCKKLAFKFLEFENTYFPDPQAPPPPAEASISLAEDGTIVVDPSLFDDDHEKHEEHQGYEEHNREGHDDHHRHGLVSFKKNV